MEPKDALLPVDGSALRAELLDADYGAEVAAMEILQGMRGDLMLANPAKGLVPLAPFFEKELAACAAHAEAEAARGRELSGLTAAVFSAKERIRELFGFLANDRDNRDRFKGFGTEGTRDFRPDEFNGNRDDFAAWDRLADEAARDPATQAAIDVMRVLLARARAQSRDEAVTPLFGKD